MTKYHIAQINIALAKAEMTSPIMEGFVSKLDEINALADNSAGFVWRLQEPGGNATSVRVFDNPLMLVNMSVWRSIEDLKQYVYKSFHVDLIRDRDAWFHKMQEAHQAIWWVPAGHIPSVEEGKAKLEHLRTLGPSQVAFTFAKPFPMPEMEKI